MTLTHAKLLDAVRAAGRDRDSFTCADVRQQLGLSTADRKQLNRFYSRFRALQQDAASEIEKLGNNCYRLRAPAVAPLGEAAAPAAEKAEARADSALNGTDLSAAEPAPNGTEVAAVPAPDAFEPPLAEPAPKGIEVTLLAESARSATEMTVLLEPAPSGIELVALAPPLPSAAGVQPCSRQADEVSARSPAADASPALEPARPAPKPRPQWLSRMASFFSRRGNKGEVTSGVAVGA